jgi:hypothetical protein
MQTVRDANGETVTVPTQTTTVNVNGDTGETSIDTSFLDRSSYSFSLVAANNGTLPNGDVPIYGLMGHGADILAAAGQQASHDLGCAGMGWAVQGGSVAASGAVLSTGTKLGGATSGTSVASATARTIRVSVPSTPTPVGIPFTKSFAWRSSSTLGGVLGRWLPYIGTAISAVLFNHCVDQHP